MVMREFHVASVAIFVVGLQLSPAGIGNLHEQGSFLLHDLERAHREAPEQSIQLSLQRKYAEPFGYVGGMRVLSDGRLIVADPLGQVLVLVNRDTGVADTLGRLGGGPNEYRQPDAVFPLPGDSTLLTDLGNARLTVLSPDGVFCETSSIPREVAGGVQEIVLPRFVDSAGRIYYQPDNFSRSGPPDSAYIVRYDRNTNAVDTIGSVMLTPSEESRSGSRVMMRRGPLRPRDDWALSTDGSVAIVRGTDYSVEWIKPDGNRIIGPSNRYESIRISAAEKKEWITNAAIENINMRMMMSASGERTIQFSRGGSSRNVGVDDYNWPRYLPPFRNRRSLVGPDGILWVERYTKADDPPIIDRFDELGNRIDSFELPHNRRVGAFSENVAFLVHTDEDGLQWVEEYRLTSY